MADEPSRKRASTRQLTDRDDVDDHIEAGDGGTWRKADSNVMQGRKIAKVRGSRSALERSASDASASPPPTEGATTSFSIGEKKEEPKVETSEKVAETTSNNNGTPAKEAPTTPAKETATPATESSTPVKESTTETKESTPAKETTPSKETTPAKTEGTPEASKGFSFPTTFSFPTSFTSTPFSFPTLSSTTTPAFSSTTTPAFSGFNFPSVNFSTGSSVFSAGGAAKKEGSDDEGDDANPEEEVAISGPAKPVIATITGEEDETTLFTVRSKLLALGEGKWNERGVGQLKINKDKDGKCRVLMRDQGGKHLRLNTALFPEMKITKANDKTVQFVAVGNGGAENVAGTAEAPTKPFTTFALRVSRKEEASDLFEALEKYKNASTSSSSSSTSTTTTASPAKPAAGSTTPAASPAKPAESPAKSAESPASKKAEATEST